MSRDRRPQLASSRATSSSSSSLILLLQLAVMISSAFTRRAVACPGSTEITLRVNETRAFASPNYPNPYPPNANCSYHIRASSRSHRVQMVIESAVLEEPLFGQCNNDQLKIKPDPISNEIIATICGQHEMTSLTSPLDELFVEFTSDSAIERDGFRMTFTDYQFPGCPPGWTTHNEQCYLLRQPRGGVTWAEARNACALEEANLLVVSDDNELNFIKNRFTKEELAAWVGYTDVSTEGIFEQLTFQTSILPSLTFHNNGNDRDCLTFNFGALGELAYVVDCRERHYYICKKSDKGNTARAAAPSDDAIRQGLVRHSADYTFWLLILVALILLLVLLCIIFHTFKRKRSNRVASTESNQRLVPPNTLATTETTRNESLVERGERAPVIRPAPVPATIPKKEQTSTQTQVAATIHHEPSEELHEMAELPGTSTQQTDQRTRHPLPEPTYSNPQLPPLAVRETTMGSSTREESFLRSKRIGELFERPKMHVLDNVSAISLDEFWHPKQ